MDTEEKVLRCSSCGAQLVVNSLVNARCVYCGSVHFIKEKFNTDFIPDAIVQFQNTQMMADESIKEFIKNGTLDKSLKKMDMIALLPLCW